MCVSCNSTSSVYWVGCFPMVFDWLGKGVKLGNIKINKYNFSNKWILGKSREDPSISAMTTMRIQETMTCKMPPKISNQTRTVSSRT